MPTNDPFDINKPVSSELDLDTPLVEPVSEISTGGLFDLSDIGQTEEFAEDPVGEIYPERETPSVLPKMFQKPQEQSRVSLEKPKKATQMPAVRAENTSVNTSAPEPQGVNLSKRKKATQMPAIRADGSAPVIPWKSAESGKGRRNEINASRNETPPERQFLGRGTVNFAMSDQKNIILTIISGVVTLLIMFLIYRFISARFDRESRTYSQAIGTMVTFGAILLGFLISVIRSGEHWHYEATGREIIFSRRGRASYIIFYKDVLAVEYHTYKFLGIIESGYLVNVLAYGRRYEFRYVFPNPARKLPFDYTPFEIIRNQIDQLGLNNP